MALGLLVACGVALGLPSGAQAAACPVGVTCSQVFFPSQDGTVLHGDLLLPAGSTGRHPVILTVSPYFSRTGEIGVLGASDGESVDATGTGPSPRFFDFYKEAGLFEKGYAVLLVDLPGVGGSAGCEDFGGPHEQAAVVGSIGYARDASWSTGHVGMFGKSYDAWTAIMGATAAPPGLDAIVVHAPGGSGWNILHQQRVGFTGNDNTPLGIAAIAATPPSAGETPQYIANGSMKDASCTAESSAEPKLTTDPTAAYWQLRLSQGLRSSRVPVFWTQGQLDQDVKPTNFDDFWDDLKGPKEAWLGQFGHDNPYLRQPNGTRNIGREGYVPQAMRWFDQYLRGIQPDTPDPQVELQDGGTRGWRTEASWPPADSSPTPFALGTVTTGASNDAGSTVDESDPGTGTGTWKITAPLPYDVHVSGIPTLTATAGDPGSGATLFAQLYDIAPDGKATIMSKSALLITTAGPITDRLFNIDWTIAQGHRIGVLIADDDTMYIDKDNSQTVTLTGTTMQIPVLKYQRATTIPSMPSYALSIRHAPLDESAELSKPATPFTVPPAQSQSATVAPPLGVSAPEPATATAGATVSTTVAAATATPVKAAVVAPFVVSAAIDRTTRGRFASRGLRFRVRCSAACTVIGRLSVDQATAATLKLRSRVLTTATTKLTRAGRKAVQLRVHGARRVASRRTAHLRLTLTARSGTTVRTLTRTVILRGRA